MRFILPIALLCSACTAVAEDRLAPGIWTNTEDEYFAEEEGRAKPAWVGFEIRQDGQWRAIDAFGVPQGDWQAGAIPNLAPRGTNGWQVGSSELRQARPFSCWFAVRKYAAKEDGSANWTFQRELAIFDQGGRVFIDGGEEAPDVTIRLRNVTWAEGSTNNPVLVLYVHRDDPVRAESYSWAAPDSAIVGINLRWVQGGCNALSTPPGPNAGPR